MTVKELKRGEYFTKKAIDEPAENQVWIRDEYDRETRKYLCYNFADINKWCLMDGKKPVFVDFTF